MEKKRRFLTRWMPPTVAQGRSGARDAVRQIEVDMAFALTYALELRETTGQIAEHSSRVALLATSMGELVDVRGVDLDRLRTAAELHEIGMVAVPPDLLIRPCRLTRDELQRVRLQASVGAEIVRASHGPGTARIIERQYDDYARIRRMTVDSRELLLAGILRVADVFDAMTAPRAYQEPVPEERWRHVLRGGSGSKFHPAAVYALLHLRQSAAAD